MGYPRNLTVDPDAPGFYHCISRCVRRAWLCGKDPISGLCFDHRRVWIEQRLIDLSESFAVGLYAWAVMSNHTHVVLRVDPRMPARWSDEEVAYRWARLSRTLEARSEIEIAAQVETLLTNPDRLEELRNRLGSLSWFMRFLNEAIARAANAEDRCTGRFWEGRFRCQALLDDQSVLGCMAYVDLNPIRAGIADEFIDSDHTTIQRRLRALAAGEAREDAPLHALAGEDDGVAPSKNLRQYVELLEWTLEQPEADTDLSASGKMPAALTAIRGSPDWWIGCVFRIEIALGTAVGTPSSLKAHAEKTGRKFLRGL